MILLLAVSSSARKHKMMSREEIRKHIEERKLRHNERLKTLLEERKTQLEDHHAGRSLLSDEHYEQYARQVTNFERKLNQKYATEGPEYEMLMEKEIDNFLKEQAGPRNVPRDL